MKKYFKDIVCFRWNPNKDLVAIVVSWILVVIALSVATFVVGAQNGGLYFVIYGILGAAIIGIGIPCYWMVFVRKRCVASLGITKKNLFLSLVIQALLFSWMFLNVYKTTSIPSMEKFLPLVALALAIGFFEAVFWRGWVQLRLEEAFGLIPAILLGSLLYAAYHIGYGMPLSEITFLFSIGLMFAIVFRLTKNVFILWPFYQPIGQIMTLLKDQLSLPFIAVLGFVEVLALMFVIVWLVGFIARKKKIALIHE